LFVIVSSYDASLKAIFAAPQPIHTELLDIIYTLTEGNSFYVMMMELEAGSIGLMRQTQRNGDKL
jgi:hypothetical protein